MYEVIKQNTKQPTVANDIVRFQAIFPQKRTHSLDYSTVTTEMIMNHFHNQYYLSHSHYVPVCLSVFVRVQRDVGAS